jgi:hypothetical protein
VRDAHFHEEDGFVLLVKDLQVGPDDPTWVTPVFHEDAISGMELEDLLVE